MDVATVKKNYVDAGTSAKGSTDSASQLIGDFSAAVAERMKQAGAVNSGNSKNALINTITSKPKTFNDTAPQSASLDTAAPVQREDAPQPRERADVVDSRDDAPVRDSAPTEAPREAAQDAPRETAQDSAPSDRGDDNSHNASSDDPSSSDTPSNHDGGEDQTQQSSEANTGNEVAVADGQVAVAAQVNVGAVAQVLAAGTGKAETVKAAAVDTSGTKQKAQKGGEVAQSTLTANVGTEDTAQESKGKGKSTAAQAQTATNSHVKAETSGAGEKGPSVIQQQAADLSKKVGPNQALNVAVNVTKQSEELVSKPGAALAGQANVKTEGESLTPTSLQAATKGQAQQAGAQTQGGQNGADGQSQGQAQQQALAQAMQADAAKVAANATDAKTAQALNSGASAQATKAGGAEGANPAQTTTPVATAQQTQQTQQAAAAAAKPLPTPHSQAHTPVTEQVQVQISKAISEGLDKIRIQLKPAHLGRIDVQLEMGQDGKVSAVISADNKSTMDLLKQDSQELQRALREAGLDLSSGDLSFNMRGENSNEAETNETTKGQSATAEPVLEPTLNELLALQSGPQQIISEDRVDVTA